MLKNTDFESKLPKDVKKRQLAMKNESKRQPELDTHLTELLKMERVIAYTEAVFRRVTCEWMIATDQVGPDHANTPGPTLICTLLASVCSRASNVQEDD